MRVSALIPLLCLLASCGDANEAIQDNDTAHQDLAKSLLSEPAATNDASPRGYRLLVLRFPDGVRGGQGKIDGLGPSVPLPPSGIDPTFPERLLQQVRDCDAVDPTLNKRVSHALYILSRSTVNDRSVIKCLQRSQSSHFTPGVSSNPDRFTEMDESPFADLFTVNKIEGETK